ncbi:MAG: ATP synthase subunit I [Acidobacteriaceae bacterium]
MDRKDSMQGLEGFTDADVRATLVRTLRLLAVLTALGMLLVGWKLGWRSAVFLLVGAAISGSGLWEWMRLMSAVMERMDAGGKARPMGMVLTGFFLRLAGAVVVLYVSLKYLNGSVIALAVGLGLGIASLTFEAIRMARTWTV